MYLLVEFSWYLFLFRIPNFVSNFLFLTANTFPHSRLSLISLRKNTSCNQDLHCIEMSWLELAFSRTEIGETRG